MKILLSSVRLLLVLTLLTGAAYPALVTGIAALMPAQAGGSLVRHGDSVVGSTLIQQSFTSPKYFHGRPSVSDFTKPDGLLGTCGSHLAPGDPRLREAVAKRREEILRTEGVAPDADIPVDLLLASASGADPHLSPAAARFQAARIARERRLSREAVEALIVANTTPGGLLGPDCVNVLTLNLALDATR